VTDDASDDGKWLTYQQLADSRQISKPSAIRLVMRHRWRRQRDNERVIRVLVPPDMLEPDRASYDAPDDRSDDAPDDTPSIAAGALAALEDAVAVLREQFDVANSRAERAEADRADERQRADDLRDRLIAMQEQLADAHAALQAAAAADARAEQAEKGREAERARADALQERLGEMLAQLAAAVADAKAAHDRAWSTGEQLAVAERQVAVARDRSDRAASGAAHEREDFLDAESRTRREVDALRERLDALQAQLTARQEVIDAAEATRRAEDERRARGLWARLRAAWRGE
jgi:DNA repair exonuclease SbcCD ATPase subunit